MTSKILDPSIQKEPFYMKSIEEVFSLLEASPKGLSSTEVKKRLEVHGPNQLKEKEKEPAWKQFFAQFNDFLIWILIGAAIFAMVEAVFQGEPPTDAIIIGAILIINALLGFYQERQAEVAIEALKKMSASKARVIRDGEVLEVLASELVPGDVFVLETGDAVPADGRVIESNDMNSEEASLTGESLPVKKSVDKIDKECPIGDKTNSVFSSTIITYGRGRAIVTATGMNTEIGKIATFISETEDEQTPLSKKIDAFGKKLGYLILIVCAISFVLYLWRGIVENPTNEPLIDIILHSILVAVALAVAAIPEGLPAIVTTSLALGVQRMAKRNAIVRKLPSVETLGCTTVICSDKTGTLTKNEMTIKTVFVDNDFIDVSGIGYEPKGEFSRNGDKIEPAIHGGLNLLAKAGVFCNNA
nr:HAD-IC family P-type ATPase [Candidatus Sigynarchaeota archaeon]